MLYLSIKNYLESPSVICKMKLSQKKKTFYQQTLMLWDDLILMQDPEGPPKPEANYKHLIFKNICIFHMMMMLMMMMMEENCIPMDQYELHTHHNHKTNK